MNIKVSGAIALIAALLAGLVSCSGPVAGGGTETTNGISGVVALDPGNNHPASIIAAIYATDYRPDSNTGFAETLYVEASGEFRFDSLDGGLYNLFIWDTTNRKGVYIPAIPSDTIFDTLYLGNTASIRPIQSNIGTEPVDAVLVIPGSPFFYSTEMGEDVLIKNIPPGLYDLTIYVPGLDGAHLHRDSTLTISPEPDSLELIPIP